jgi:hypothetical protein
VIESDDDASAIASAIVKALSPAFQAGLTNVKSLYGRGGASRAIVEQLRSQPPSLAKKFFDIEHGF